MWLILFWPLGETILQNSITAFATINRHDHPKGDTNLQFTPLSETTSIPALSFTYGSSPSQARTCQCLRVPALQGSVAFSHDVSSLLAEVVDKDSTLWHIPPKKMHSQQLHLPSNYKHNIESVFIYQNTQYIFLTWFLKLLHANWQHFIQKISYLYDIWISHSNSCHNILLQFSYCLDAPLKKRFIKRNCYIPRLSLN